MEDKDATITRLRELLRRLYPHVWERPGMEDLMAEVEREMPPPSEWSAIAVHAEASESAERGFRVLPPVVHDETPENRAPRARR